MKLLGCATLALTVIAGTADAGDWRWFYTSNNTLYFVDAASIREVDGRKLAWMTYAYRNVSPGQADYLVTRIEFDCDAEATRTRNATGYNKEGNSVGSDQSLRSFEPVIPDTAGQAALNAVCLNSFSDVQVETPYLVYQTAVTYWQGQDDE